MFNELNNGRKTVRDGINTEPSRFEKVVWLIGIITSIIMIFVHSKSKNGSRHRR